MTSLSKGFDLVRPGCPVLVVLGGKDTDVPPASGRELAENLKADLFEYAEMSHVGPLLGRRAGEVASTVVQWLGNVRPKRHVK
jgi:pimeloyl-ACP methyl ester carboxylesterase